MIVLLRFVIIAITAVLSAIGIVLAVAALLAAQWLLVAGVMLLGMAIVGGAVALAKRLAQAAGVSGPED